MFHVSRSIVVNAPLDAVWSAIGGFQALPDWHPAVEASAREVIDGVEHRRLRLMGGGMLLEKLLDADGPSYAYEIVEGALPVARYRAAISAVAVGDKTAIVWASTFDGTTIDAAAAIAGVYDAGFVALTQRFGG